MRTSLLICAALLAGCAAPAQYAWVPIPGSTANYAHITARCDYETSAATQGTDYSFRTSFGRELDRALRKSDLLDKCMRAYGFQKVAVDASALPTADPRWKALEDDWGASKARRRALREQLDANPTAADADETRAEIQSLNVKVRELERRLSYSPTPSTSTD